VDPDVSICIASCRRPEGLARLLASLARLEPPDGLAWEVIVVDNDPEGGAAPLLSACGLPGLRRLAEPRRNIAHARNRALDAARGRWLAFLDDDEVAEPGWLAAFAARVRAGDCDGLFGPVLPQLERDVTPWLRAEAFYARARHPTGTRLGRAELSTSNAFVRRSLLERRRFDPALGLRGGSDTELFGRLLELGARFLWCDEARVHEWVPPARHRLGWLAQRAFRGGFVHTLLEQRRRGRTAAALRGWPRSLAGLALCALGLPLAALGGRAALARLWLRGCTQAGHLWALLGRDYQEYGAA